MSINCFLQYECVLNNNELIFPIQIKNCMVLDLSCEHVTRVIFDNESYVYVWTINNSNYLSSF